MLINLRSCTARDQSKLIEIELVERLPENIVTPCTVNCNYEVQSSSDYYLLSMQVKGLIQIECQRCLSTFSYNYDNQTTLAACSSEEMAEKLLSDYETVVAENNQVDLKELIIDELILNCPKKHLDINDCDSDVERFIIRGVEDTGI